MATPDRDRDSPQGYLDANDDYADEDYEVEPPDATVVAHEEQRKHLEAARVFAGSSLLKSIGTAPARRASSRRSGTVSTA